MGWQFPIDTTTIQQGANQSLTMTAGPLGATNQTTVTIDQPPTITLSSPAPGGSGNATFSFTVKTSTGMSNEQWINGMIAPSLGAIPACSFSFWVNYNAFALINDAGTAWQYGTLNSGLSNSECRINTDSSYIPSGDGKSGTLNLDVTFLSGLQGQQQIWMITADDWLGSNWTYAGTWTPAPLSITTTSLPNGVQGVSYSQTLSATGGTPPYTWSLYEGWPPNGLSLSSSGQLSGTPTSSSTGNFWVSVRDSVGALAVSQQLTVTITGPPPPTVTIWAPWPGSTISGTYTMSGSASDSATPINYVQIFDGSTQVGSNIPGGAMNVQWQSTVNTGTLPQGINQTFTVSATDEDSPPQTGQSSVYSVTVDQPPTVSFAIDTSQRFAFSASSSLGAPSIQILYGWIAPSLGAQGCAFVYYPGSNTFSLYNDAGNSLLPGVYIASAGSSTSNSQCTVNAGASLYSAPSSSSTATLSLSVSFAPTFTGPQQINEFASDGYLYIGWQQVGSYTITAPPITDFTMSAPTPASLTVTPAGTQGSYTQTFQAVNGFSSNVGLSYSVSPQPSAGGLQFTTASVNVSGSSSTLQWTTVSALWNTPGQTYTVTITGTATDASGTHVHNSLITVNVTGSPALSAWPTSPFPVTIAIDNAWHSYSQPIQGLNGLSGTVNLVNLGQSGSNCANVYFQPGYSTAYIDPATGFGTVYGMVEALNGAQPGFCYFQYAGVGTGQYGGVYQVFTGTVVVSSSSQSADFQVSMPSASASISAGGGPYTFTELVTSTSGFSSPVTFTTSGSSPAWPPGVNVTINPSTVSVGQQATISIQAVSGMAPVHVTPYITVSGGGKSHTIPVTLDVSTNPSFTLSASPGAQTVNSFGSATYQLTVTGANNFGGTVNFNVTGLPQGSMFTLDPPTVQGTGSTLLTVTVPPVVAQTTYTLVVAGNSGNLGTSVVVPLVVPGSTPVPATMITPPNGNTITSTTVAFSWTTGTVVSQYRILVGTSPGASDIFSLTTGSQNAIVQFTSNPTTLYATLGSMISGAWQTVSYTYPVNLRWSSPGQNYLTISGTSQQTSQQVSQQTTGLFQVPDNGSLRSASGVLSPTGNCADLQPSCKAYYVSGGVNTLDNPVTATLSDYSGPSCNINFTASYGAALVDHYVNCAQKDGTTVPVCPGATCSAGTPVITVAAAAPNIGGSQSYGPIYPTGAQGSNYISLYGSDFTTSPRVQVCPQPLCGTGQTDSYLSPTITYMNNGQINVKISASPFTTCLQPSCAYSIQFIRSDGHGGNTFSNWYQAIKISPVPATVPAKIFLIHGIGQTASDMTAFQQRLTQRLDADGYDSTKVMVDASYNWPCATNASCDSSCGINNGAALLASTVVGATVPGQQIMLVGYSMGGLIARDMLAHAPPGNGWNPTGYPALLQRNITALVTLGTPNLGYPWATIDDAGAGPIGGVCPFQTAQMSSDFRQGQSATPNPTFIPHMSLIPGSDYLRQLTSDWSASVFTSSPLNVYWYAISGSYCSSPIRFSGGSMTSYGCPDYNPWSDGIVCDQSSRYQLQDPYDPGTIIPQARDILLNSIPGNPPDSSYAAPGFAHTTLAVMCPGPTNTPNLLYSPPTFSPVMDQVVYTIEGYR